MASKPYRTTMIFNEETLPAALRRTHSTKSGVWGVLRVIAGSLRYVVEDGSGAPVRLASGDTVVILPQQPHHVEVTGSMQMLVEFYDHHPVVRPGREPAEEADRTEPSGTRAAYLKERQLDEATVVRVVDTFYGRIRRDALLGEIFDRMIGDHWDRHLQTMYDFWSSVMLMSGRYKGTPMQKHVSMTQLTEAHFGRWLELFELTVTELCVETDARLFMEKAQMIARSFQYGIQVARGELPPRISARAV